MFATLYSKNLMHPPYIYMHMFARTRTHAHTHTHSGSASLALGNLDGAGSESPLALTNCQGA